MIDVYRNDEEQITVLKDWWCDNRAVLLTALLVSVLVSGGWRYWQYKQSHHRKKAATMYMQLQVAHQKHDDEATDKLTDKLMHRYRNTIYGSFAALQLARHAVKHGHLPQATSALMWVVDNAPTSGVKQLASYRLARVYLSDAQPKKAIDVLHKAGAEASYQGAWLAGQAYVMLHQRQQALAAYKRAEKVLQSSDLAYAQLAILPQGQSLSPKLQTQLSDAMARLNVSAHIHTAKKGS